MARINLDVNGKVQTIDADPDMPLLYALRNDLGLNNPHFGCGLAQCGACTVHVDGQAVRSCVTPVSAVGTSKIVTLAGLGTPDKPHPIQKAYVEEQVPQCGYCINGWIMTAAVAARSERRSRPTPQIKDALTGLKCRCGTHMGIMRAVKRAVRDDGLREATMTRHEKAAHFSRRSLLKAGGALVVSVGAPIALDTVLGIGRAFAQGTFAQGPSRR